VSVTTPIDPALPPPLDHGETMRHRWQHFLKLRRDEEGNARDDLLQRGRRDMRRMPLVAVEERPAPAGAPEPTVFAGVSWVGIGPQPLRIDKEQVFQGSGPASGEVVDILVDPRSEADQTIYIATNNGGVWKTTNGGASWDPKTDLMPSLSMGAMAMDPVDPDVIYAGTGNNFDGGAQFIRGNGIYRSIDAGATWTVLADTLLANRHVVAMAMPASNLLLVATDAGLFRSIDAGRTFGANAPAFDDANPVLAGAITDLLLDSASITTVYACVRGTGVFRSTDASITFPTNLFSTPGAPTAPFDWISLAQSVKPDNQVLYALVTDSTVPPPGARFKGLFRSPDAGGSWTPMPGAAQRAAENGGLQNGYDVTVAVDPLDANRVYIGFQEMYLSTDGAQNFGTPAITANRVHFDHHATVFTAHLPAAAPTPFYVGTDGGISRNSDGNTAWTNLNETIATNLLQSLDIGRGSGANNGFTFAGAQDTGTSQRTPASAGNDWHLDVDGDGTRVVVDPNNPERVYARDNQSLIVTSDGGTSWAFPTALATGLPPVSGRADANAKPMAVDPNSSAVVYVASGAQLYRSTDTGATFTLMHTFPDVVSAMGTTKQDSKVLVVGCEGGSVHRTADADAGAGSTWTALTVTGAPGLIVSGVAIDPTDVKAVAITYAGFTTISAVNRTKHVFFSADVTSTALEDVGGTDGTGSDTNVPDLPCHDVVIDASTMPRSFIIGCDVDVLRSTDGGATWHIYGAGLPNADCTSLAIDHSTSPPLLRVGTYGRSAFELSRPSGPQIVVRGNLAFGDVPGGASSDLTFNVFNVGSSSLDIASIADATANPSFSVVGPTAPLSIAPGDHVGVAVRFAPTAAGKHMTSFSVNSNDPAHPALAVPASGLSPTTGPQVTGILPSSGPAAGGTPMRVMGSGLTGATSVRFGATAATGLTIDSDNQVEVLVPPGTGVVDVVVVTPAGTTPASPAARFTYLGAGMVITGLSPTEGPETGGTSVRISGSGFTGATQVLFEGFGATGMTVDNDAQITAVSPAGSGTVDVLVATPGGTSPPSAAAKFRYTAPGGGISTGGTGTGGGVGTGSGANAATGENQVLSALAEILHTGTDPEVLEAQRILLRRIALEGNIIDSRVPPPKNITEVGGYINLLTTLSYLDIQTQMLASTLGVAGPATPIGLSGEGPVLSFVRLPNDRPDGSAQPTLTPTISVRSDMADALASALQRIHGFGCALPLYTPPRVLPVAEPGRAVDADLLEILGRVLRIAPTAILRDPATDAVAIARLAGGPPDRWQLVAREIDGSDRVAEASWEAYEASDADVTVVPPAPRRYVPVAPLLADAGYAAHPVALPTSSTSQGSLTRLLNTTGLLPGETRLGDELRLLYTRAAIAASPLAEMTNWVWNGTAFVPLAAPPAP
jgi:photosystem II stability/assembly factor-like uncharacterized protein